MYEKLQFDVGYFEGGHTNTIKENTPEFLRYYIFDTYSEIFALYNYIQTTLSDQLETSTE